MISLNRLKSSIRLQILLLAVLLAAFRPAVVLAQPSVSVTSPHSNDCLHGTTPVAVMASGVNHITYVELFYQKGVIQGEVAYWTQGPYTSNWDTTKLDNGTYTLYARAGDDTGAQATSQNITVKIENPACAGASAFTPSLTGVFIIVLAVFSIGAVVVYRSRTRKALSLPRAAAQYLNF